MSAMRFNKKSSTVFAFLFAMSSVFAFEWGGKLSNDTNFIGHDELKLKQIDTLKLWIKTPLNKDNSVYFAGEGLYQFKYDVTEYSGEDSVSNILDLNLFKVNATIPVGRVHTVSLSAGRFNLSDNTGLIFNQQFDGAAVKWSSCNFNVNAFVGYTGLLNSKIVTILNSETKTWEEDKDNDVYNLCGKYLPFGASVALPSLFANQQLDVQVMGFADLNDNDGGDAYNRFYGTLGLNGYLYKNLSYNLKTTFGTENFDTLMNLSSLRFNMFFTKTIGMNLGGVFASGENGKLSAFKGFTSVTAIEINSPIEAQYSSILKLDIGYTQIFANVLFCNLNCACVFDTAEDADDNYLGVQFNADLMWNVVSDLQLGASFRQFVGNDAELNKTSLAIKAVVVF